MASDSASTALNQPMDMQEIIEAIGEEGIAELGIYNSSYLGSSLPEEAPCEARRAFVMLLP